MKNTLLIVGIISTSFLLTSCGTDPVAENKPTNPSVQTATETSKENSDMPKNPLAEPDKPVIKAEVSTLGTTPDKIKDEDALSLIKDKDIKFEKYVIGDQTIIVVGKTEYKKLGVRAIEIITLLNAFVSDNKVKELIIDGKLKATLGEDGKTITKLTSIADPKKSLDIKEKNIFKLLNQ